MQEKMKNNTDISERIIQMLEYLDIKSNNFALKIGYSRSQMLYDIINGKSKPSFDFFNRFINSEFSAIIDLEWLISGKGLMIKEQQLTSNCINCPNCALKDKMISTLEKFNEAQAKTIELLEEKLKFDVRESDASVADVG